MDFEDALRVAGEFGKYQVQFYLIAALPVIVKGFQVMLVVFTVYVPKHRCAVPGLENDTYHIVSEEHRQLVVDSIPAIVQQDGQLLFDQCRVYAQGNSTVDAIGFSNSTSTSSSNYSRGTEACDRWVYDTSEVDNSLITKFNLVCEQKVLRSHSNMMMMAGFLASSSVISVLCDWFGRKPVYYICLSTMVISGIISAFPPSPEALLIFRFLSGFGLIGMFVTGFVLVVETMGGPMRTRLGAAWQIMWLIGPFVLAAVTYFVRDWQHLQLLGSVPALVFLAYWWVVPESPRWLISKGRVSEAMVTLRKVAKTNGKVMPDSLEEKLQERNLKQQREQQASVSVSPLVLFRYPILLARCFIISFNWAIISMTYFGLSLNVSNLSGGLHVNFLVSCAVELVGYSLSVFLLDRLGRKLLHTSAMLTAGVACLLTIVTVLYAGEHSQWLTTLLAMVGKMGVSTSFSVIYVFSAELYPTVLRNFGLGCGSVFARFGSIVSPYIADLALYLIGPMSTAVPLMIFGSLAVAAGMLSLLLPETLHRKLPETVLDAVYFGKTEVDLYENEEDKEEEMKLSKSTADTMEADSPETDRELCSPNSACQTTVSSFSQNGKAGWKETKVDGFEQGY